jgi:gliding motility-associated-like protein
MKTQLRIQLFLITLLTFGSFKAQNLLEYTINMSSVTHNFQCGSDGFFSDPEPRWKVRSYHVGGAVPGYTVINLGDGVNCGTYGNASVLSNFTNVSGGVVCANDFEIDYQSWEEDGCGSDNDYNGGGCANNDENVASSTNTYSFIAYPQNVNNTITISSSNGYNFNVVLNWNQIDAPIILGTSITTGCSGSSATLNASAPETITGGTFYWYTAASGGVSVATGATYSPVITASTTYYVAYGTASCETVRTAVSVTETTSSTAPTTLTSTPTALCATGTVNLTVGGGSLGSGALYELYSGSCGGTLIATSPTPNFNSVAVTASTDFYVRISGTCNTTGCVTNTVNVSTPSTAATGATASTMTSCSGDPVTLTVTGGVLGTGSDWEWYDLGCGSGFNVGTGASISASPTTTTTYFVRAEGGCGPTTCQSITITVEQPSTDPSSISASALSYCAPGSSTLTLVGGTLGTAATWEWYAAGCGAGATVGTGTSITVSPIATTTYYVRGEGTCNNTACVSVTIVVDQSGTDPTGIVAGNSSLCPGQSTTLSVTGGSLGTGATWEWYSGSCGGTSVGSGNTIAITPASTTTYFVRAEGTCGNSNCASTTVTIGVGSAGPTSATVINNNICPGDTAEVYVTGAALPSGYSWVWYTGACGAIPVGIGDTISVTPSATETYYVRAVGTCGATNCTSVTVTVQDGSIAATGISTDNNDFCAGGTANLTITGGSLVAGAQWTWYANSCGGAAIGTGATLSVTPNSNTTYYARAEGGACGNTECRDISISVLETDAYMVAFEDQCGLGLPFELDNGLPAGGVYSGTGVTGSDFDPSIAGVGTHTITYTYNDLNGCSATASADITLDNSPVIGAATVEVETCSDGGVIILATATGGTGFYTYNWSNGSNGNPLTYVEAGTYAVTITDGNNCSTTVTDIEVADDLACIEVPNTFTPNGDGMNDTWNLDFTANSSARLQVFSKWGTLVYETTELTINWNGNSSDGAVLPSGTYYYILDLDNGATTQNGPISIVR